ncbi:MAG: sugar ABC transporter ATP-binding protein [Planctomycetota bacterium]
MADLRLRIEGAMKRFGGTTALAGVDLVARAGEIHALLGENGAGKSTLMKVLSGAVAPDEGRMWIDGVPYAPRSPREARERGVAMIYQELELCPHLTVLENVTLGVEEARYGLTRADAARASLVEILKTLGVATFGPDTRVANLSPGDRQLVEIARALAAGAQILVFDEPTSSLSRPDVERLFEVARSLTARGAAVLWISHFLDEVEAIGDRFTVLRDGASVGEGDVRGTSVDEIVALMVGQPLDGALAHEPRSAGDVVLEVEGLAGLAEPRCASFELRAGEILGVFGLVGAGRTEMLRVLFGLDSRDAGTVRLRGEEVDDLGPRRWIERGVGLASEDRAHEGVALDLSIADNVTLSSLGSLARRGFLSGRRKVSASVPWIERLGIKAASPSAPARSLSGGNQQKVALARLLECGVDVLLLDEPTRGIDIGAKREVYALLDALARGGRAVLVVSSQMPELLALCDRIAVMRRGETVDVRARDEWTEEAALAAATAGVGAR